MTKKGLALLIFSFCAGRFFIDLGDSTMELIKTKIAKKIYVIQKSCSADTETPELKPAIGFVIDTEEEDDDEEIL